MQFKHHLGKGMWAFADKALPAIWGVCNIFLVQKVLPISEYAGLAVVLQVFMLVTTLCTAFAFQPLLKFAAESENPADDIAASLFLSVLFYIVSVSAAFAFKGSIIHVLDKTGQGNLPSIYAFLPLLFIGAWYRNFAVNLLQARYQVARIFFVDASYYLGVPSFIVAARMLGLYGTAKDVIVLNIAGLFLSSAIALVLTAGMLRQRWRLQAVSIARIWNFGKYSFWGTSMYSLFAQADVFFVSSFAGILVVAPYSVAKTFTRLFDMLTQVIQMFLIPFSAKTSSKGDTKSLVVVAEKAVCFSTVFFLPVFIIFFFFPLPILHTLYHGKFDQAAPILRVLSLTVLMIPWNAVIASYLVGTGRVREGFYSNILLMFVALPLYYFLTPLYGAVGTALGLVVSFYIVTIALILYMRRTVPISPINTARRVVDIWSFVRSYYHNYRGLSSGTDGIL